MIERIITKEEYKEAKVIVDEYKRQQKIL